MLEKTSFLLLIFVSWWVHEGDRVYYVTVRQLQRLMAARFDIHRSRRQILRYLDALEDQGLISRFRFDRQFGPFGPDCQATGYTVNDPVKALRYVTRLP